MIPGPKLNWKKVEKISKQTIGVCIENIKERHLEESLLMPAVQSMIKDGRVDVVGVLLEKGMNINQQDVHGYTPLMYAVLENKPELVKALLDKGADPHITNKLGKTAMHIALQSKDPQSLAVPFIEPLGKIDSFAAKAMLEKIAKECNIDIGIKTSSSPRI
mgnify:CR=1 FL=1